ncbi:hypothetical protein [Pedobacter glucosidilyticus]|uniref:hypothetical protein n=1 Tax=Pedobacter glucosidilyticus TaxID=1122941 RepID=UPI0026EB711B|nr:hypothetical protein [Pedobacter glucosidilyticus]
MKSAPHIVMNADFGGSHMTTKLIYIKQRQLTGETSIHEDYENFNLTIPYLFNDYKGISKIKRIAQFNSFRCLNTKRMNLSYLEKIEYNKPNYKPN